MQNDRGKLVLASASPRRKELLKLAGFRFEVDPAGVDETVDAGLGPLEVAALLARRKAAFVAAKGHRSPVWVLGADTVVAVEVDGRERLLGKPVDEREARQFLEWLSDSRHQVVTGVCVIGPTGNDVLVECERTWVRMRRIEDNEARAYVESGEWNGKAGGYAIQENADAFVTELKEGGFDNVVGLPVALTTRLLRQAGFGGPGA